MTRKQLFTVLLSCIIWLFSATGHSFAQSAQSAHSFIYYDQAGLNYLKTEILAGKQAQLRKSIITAANNALEFQPASVTHKTMVPPSGDLHDYASLARYWWPNPVSANGLPYIRRDGVTNPERRDLSRYDAVRLDNFTKAVSKLALGYYLTDEPAYAEHAAILLRTWFIDPTTRMNPNMNFGQGVPGRRQGSPGGIIDTVNLIEVTDAARMLEGSKFWTKADDQAMREWFTDYLHWLRASTLGKKEDNSINNHSVWYDAQVSAFALFTRQSDLAAKVSEAAKLRRIAAQIEPDGRMPHELSRTRPIHYSVYTAAAFITLARVGDHAGVNLWNYQTEDGRSIRNMLSYLEPYLNRTSDWDSESGAKQRRAWFSRYLAIAARSLQADNYAKIASDAVIAHSKESIAAHSFSGGLK